MTSKCILLLLVAGVFNFVGTHAQSDCHGKVGQRYYNLTALAEAVGDNDGTTQDQAGNTYYYRPCRVIKQAECSQGPINPNNAAICQKDNRLVPKYHNDGVTTSVQWKQRASGGDASGFILHFTDGEAQRQSVIEFICDVGAGRGFLTALRPAENPTHYYHLQWKSKYACPNAISDETSWECELCEWMAELAAYMIKKEELTTYEVIQRLSAYCNYLGGDYTTMCQGFVNTAGWIIVGELNNGFSPETVCNTAIPEICTAVQEDNREGWQQATERARVAILTERKRTPQN